MVDARTDIRRNYGNAVPCLEAKGSRRSSACSWIQLASPMKVRHAAWGSGGVNLHRIGDRLVKRKPHFQPYQRSNVYMKITQNVSVEI